jgi:hypothetical protein
MGQKIFKSKILSIKEEKQLKKAMIHEVRHIQLY